MTKSTFLIGLMFVSVVTYGQNISVTFIGKGVATQIDSVTATNLKTNESVTLPGNETLVLTGNTGIPKVSELTSMGVVYPNPFSGRATFSATVDQPQSVYLKVQNLVGQVVAQTQSYVQPGENEFALSVNAAGIYIVSLTTEQGTAGYKVICTNAAGWDNRIQYLSGSTNNHNNPYNPSSPQLKASQTGYILGYTSGEIILYKCFSGIYTTIVTDSLISPKNYEVEFAPCTDADGKNYSIVKIGDQTWMAENLAWLPEVNKPNILSKTGKHYYVYGYWGTNVDSAKATANYSLYGALYNWTAAMDGSSSSNAAPSGVQGVCPFGWHIPSWAEWTALSDFLGPSGGGKMKETGLTHWLDQNRGATNATGFTALPGGYRSTALGRFEDAGFYTHFWTSTEVDATSIEARTSALAYYSEGLGLAGLMNSEGLSVRCIQHDVGNSTAPVPAFTVNPPRGTVATLFQFDASGSEDAQTSFENLEVRWDWNGDGTWDTRYDKSKNISIRFPESGGYSVILEVKDDGGLAATHTQIVLVGDGTFTDARDSREYAYINIGNQTWMMENLDYLPMVRILPGGSVTDPRYYVYGYQGHTAAGAKATENYATYGVLYNWEAAKTACPSGWHLPSDPEWSNLTDYLGSDAGAKLKATSGWIFWGHGENGDNSSGFTALPGGYYMTEIGFSGAGFFGMFRSATAFDATYSWNRNIETGIGPENYYKKAGVSVRCEKDGFTTPVAGFSFTPRLGAPSTIFQFDASGSTDVETNSKELEVRWDWTGDGTWDTGYDTLKTYSHQFLDPGSYRVILEVKDKDGLVDTEIKTVIVADGILTDSRDGQDYAYKRIGTQTWMIENLAYLPAVSPSSAESYTDPYFYVYGYEGSIVSDAKAASNYTTYGVLYNWEAAKKACPIGWHLPSDTEWTVLTDYLGSSAGKKMKATSGWNSNVNSDNSSGFSALPGGCRLSDSGSFYSLGSNAYFWSSSENLDFAWYRHLSDAFNGVDRPSDQRLSGFSVRCLMD